MDKETIISILERTGKGDLLEILLQNGLKQEVIYGTIENKNTLIIGLHAQTLADIYCKLDDVESVKLLKKAADFITSHKEVLKSNIFMQFMGIQ